jgi:anti-sigma regulatory factor (Ser/Thr protein kinase)
MTMVCLEMKGETPARLVVDAECDELDKVNSFIHQHLGDADLSPKMMMDLDLAVEEIFVNIANYAYDGKEGNADISFSFNEEDRMVKMVFTDSGFPFDPTNRPRPRLTSTPGNRPVGGLGIHIVKKTMDKVKYDYLAGKNTLTIEKHI